MNKNFFKLFMVMVTIVPLTAALIANAFEFDSATKVGLAFFIFVGAILSGGATFNPSDFNLKPETSLPKVFKPLFAILLVTFLVFLFPFRGMINLYNTQVRITNEYKQKTNERVGYYDKLWKTYSQKESIAKVNKETFIEVAKTVMEYRKDGSNLTWKWVQENQPIPFEEFTAFYKDLSAFIEGQRKGYFDLEKECLTLAKQNNILLDTFPNNVYNKLLGLKHIDFNYGFTSDSTNQIFDSGIENLK